MSANISSAGNGPPVHPGQGREDTGPGKFLDHRDVRIEDPAFYALEPNPVYHRLHAEAPVFRYEPLDLWVVSRHADIRIVGRSSSFTATKARILNDVKFGNVTPNNYPDGAELMSMSDPPSLQRLRRLVGPAFASDVMRRLEGRIRDFARSLLAEVPRGEDFDFLPAFAEPLPLLAIVAMLGLRDPDMGLLKTWTDQFIEFGNAATKEQLAESARSLGPMKDYLREEIEAQRRDPQGGLISTLAEIEVDGERLTAETLLMFCQLLVVAGNETTRHTLAGQLDFLLSYPDELAALRRDPGLIGNAVEETIRLLSPFIGRVVCAKERTEIAGQPIEPDEPVFTLFAAGNRDANVFDAPDLYRASRANAAQHVAFGFGGHFCLGAPLARLEIRIFLEELLGSFSTLERAAEPVRLTNSILINGYTSLMVRLK